MSPEQKSFSLSRGKSTTIGRPTTEYAIAYSFFLIAHVLAALYAPIQDCDEVFNFWEPTHYLNHGYGMQTWELSPIYAIRSWAYITLHAIPIYLASLLPFVSSKVAEFYCLRLLLAMTCTHCEMQLFNSIKLNMNPRIAWLFLIATASSAGTFIAAASYLPSSFAMYTMTLAMATFMQPQPRSSTAKGLTWLALGTILGWPFVAVLALPYVFKEVVTSGIAKDIRGLVTRLSDGFARSLVILAVEIAIDSTFYQKITCVPLNIVWYNVFASGQGKGPDIYGTEPWHFYIRNLLINFNIWFILATLALPLLLFQHFLRYSGTFKNHLFRSLIFTSPFYLWLAIFTLQPHKEERFMYPIYPSIAFNAALALHIIILNLSNTTCIPTIRAIPTTLRISLITSIIALAAFLGLFRSAGLTTAYSAPLHIYTPLAFLNTTTSLNICIGKEWYRYPSSYHLPSQARLRFIPSSFDGLLPGSFVEPDALSLAALVDGTATVPEGMNDLNEPDPAKYSTLAECDYMVDSRFASVTPTMQEPDYADTDGWEKVLCLPFLDPQTAWIGRLGWMPEGWARQWGEYCLLRRLREGDDLMSVME